ncbi:MAG: hypothetical protein KDJ16_01360 [Hyphomicrobiales bacterium]|nr:hypothetical protein [Hyphomicrobiales bacterium]
MAVLPPEKRIWWNEPIEKVELTWVIIALLWGFFMFGFMIAWHFIGNQNLNNEAYRVVPSAYQEKVEAFAEQYTVGDEEGVPIVAPPAGSDAYMLARTFEWWPILQLQKGQSYRFHISSVDLQHGFSLLPTNINIQIHPGYEHVITLTPTETGEFGVVCNEYCGLGHHVMTGKIIVVDKQAAADGQSQLAARKLVDGGVTQ